MQIRNFIHNETTGSIVLILATLLALICANSGWADGYATLLAMPLKIGVTVSTMFYGLDVPVFLWINDALMTLFFLMIGLEIKRELFTGELSTPSKALQPLFAAIGGVVFPVLIFSVINFSSPETQSGWAIPCATDIAFALGMLALLGNRVPPAIKVLLTAIAIIDDLIAIIVIAVFYSHGMEAVYLLGALAGVIILYGLHFFNVMRISLYLLGGTIVWVSFLKAGIHPTLAGVVTAMAIPLDGKNKSPLIVLEKALHPWVVFFIVPLFAFANAGLSLTSLNKDAFSQPLTLGIILGLVIGKPLGIMAGLGVGHYLGYAKKPKRFDWGDYFGMATLCGIGFTMALFIGELGFNDPVYIDQVKLGVLSASLVMALCGLGLCRFNFERKKNV